MTPGTRYFAAFFAGAFLAIAEALEAAEPQLTDLDARAGDRSAAVAAAEEIGYPVAVKTRSPGVQHKSDVGGVRVFIDDSPSLEEAYEDLERHLGPRVTVSEMAPRGVEVALGIEADAVHGRMIRTFRRDAHEHTILHDAAATILATKLSARSRGRRRRRKPARTANGR